jgi:hypothetical protein
LQFCVLILRGVFRGRELVGFDLVNRGAFDVHVLNHQGKA